MEISELEGLLLRNPCVELVGFADWMRQSAVWKHVMVFYAAATPPSYLPARLQDTLHTLLPEMAQRYSCKFEEDLLAHEFKLGWASYEATKNGERILATVRLYPDP